MLNKIKFLIISRNSPNDTNKMFSVRWFVRDLRHPKVSHRSNENNKLILNPQILVCIKLSEIFTKLL